ncbi:MAG: hypothetical protein AB1508_18965 [Pseudomonadota bacterium]
MPTTDGSVFWEDDFSGSDFGNHWNVHALYGTEPTLDTENGYVVSDYATGTPKQGLYSGTFAGGRAGNYLITSTASTSYTVIVMAKIVPFAGQQCGTYELFCLLNDGSPNIATNGIRLTFTITGATGTYAAYLTYVDNGVTQIDEVLLESGTQGHPEGGWLELRAKEYVDGASVVSIEARWRGARLGTAQSVTPFSFGAGLGSRIAFTMTTTVAGGQCRVSAIRHAYRAGDLLSYSRERRAMVVGRGEELRREEPTGYLSVIPKQTSGYGVSLASGRRMRAVRIGRRLYIANRPTPFRRNLTPTLAGSDTVLWWEPSLDKPVCGTLETQNGQNIFVGVDTENEYRSHICVITRADTRQALGPAPIRNNSVIGGYQALTLDYVSDLTAEDLPASEKVPVYVTIHAKPAVYDIDRNMVYRWYAKAIGAGKAGIVPPGCPLMCKYLDRIVFGGEPDGCWYMSRADDPMDWNYFATTEDVERAVFGHQDSLTALIPVGQDYLIFGGEDRIWLLRGNPVTGIMGLLTTADGIISGDAWCEVPGAGVCALGQSGLYLMQIGESSSIAPLSKAPLPKELARINTLLYDPILAWDADHGGIHIWLSGAEATVQPRLHYWFDWDTKSFWPERYDIDGDPVAVVQRTGMWPSHRGLLIGTRDGQLLRFDREAVSDIGVPVDNYVLYGPVRASDQPVNAVLAELTATVGS